MQDQRKQRRSSLALVLGSFSALGPFTVDMYLSSLPRITDFFETSTSMVQASLTASLLGIALGQIFMGPLSDVYGRRKPLVFSMILYVLFSIGCAFSPNIGVFISLRFFQGFFASAGLVIPCAIVRDLYSGTEMTQFVSLLTMIGNIAPLVSPVAGSAVVSYTSWIGVFLSLGLLGIALWVVAVWGIKETLPAERRIPSRLTTILQNYKQMLRDRIFMGYAFITGILFAGVFAYVAGTPFIYQNLYGVSPLMFSILFAMNGGGYHAWLPVCETFGRSIGGKSPSADWADVGVSFERRCHGCRTFSWTVMGSCGRVVFVCRIYRDHRACNVFLSDGIARAHGRNSVCDSRNSSVFIRLLCLADCRHRRGIFS
ncbi:multidrug effflux MFS transporter [Geobacillus thermoleovorans]|uniref:multidrug effflux MFS transporter n=1 Tax=Geobacillus thermoleovorans TaxID=33941 RepID=UPI003460C01B